VADRTRPRRNPRKPGGTLKDGERRQLARASRHASDAPALPLPGDRPLVLCDGGSRGNPGTAAVAALLLAADGSLLEQRAALIGHASAAEAEYRAILLGLELATAHGVDPLEVRCDSQLAITALSSATPVAPDLERVVSSVRRAAAGFSSVRWRWHPRTANEAADALVRELLWPH
jgi:ribonuclease HI